MNQECFLIYSVHTKWKQLKFSNFSWTSLKPQDLHVRVSKFNNIQYSNETNWCEHHTTFPMQLKCT